MAAKFEVSLPNSVHAPGIARRSLTEWLLSVFDTEEVYTAELLTGELVTNAVIHGYGTITLHAQLEDDRLRVEVFDEGRGFGRTIPSRYADRAGGLGLKIVAALASRWGIHDDDSRVWFELERPMPRLGQETQPVS